MRERSSRPGAFAQSCRKSAEIRGERVKNQNIMRNEVWHSRTICRKLVFSVLLGRICVSRA